MTHSLKSPERDAWLKALKDHGRFLTFQFKEEDYDQLNWRHLAIGLFITWLVGIARNWDNAEAPLFASLGLASLIYIVFLSFFFWIAGLVCFDDARGPVFWVTFVSMTAAPGLIYGIPVEAFLSPDTAASTNLSFLLVVASWRVALLVVGLAKMDSASTPSKAVVAVLPVSAIISFLFLVGLSERALALMGGLDQDAYTPSRPVVEFLSILGAVSIFSFAATSLAFFVMAWQKLGEWLEDRSAERRMREAKKRSRRDDR